MDFTKYSNYSLNDFLEDDDFVDSVIDASEERDQYWAAFRLEYPLQASVADNAANIIKVYRQQEVFTNAARQDAVWQRIETTLKHQPDAKIFRLPFLFKAAAVLLVAFGIALGYKAYQNRMITVNTAYGEITKITLPDGSEVTLNANSKLSYANDWNEGIRAVWVDGEAYFKVKHINTDPSHIKTNERFVVHCADVNVEVLGTEFNVKRRHNKTNVGLISGKIRLDYLAATPAIAKSVIMKPGDFIEYSAKKIKKVEKLANPAKITRWASGRFVFTDVRLSDVVESLEDDYGLQVKLSDPAMANLKIEGEINVASVNELLETITTVLHVNVYQNDNAITIYSVKP